MTRRPDIRMLLDAVTVELQAARVDDRLTPSAKGASTRALSNIDCLVRLLQEQNPRVYHVNEVCRSVAWDLMPLTEPQTKKRGQPVYLENVTLLREALLDLRAGDLAALFPLAHTDDEQTPAEQL